MADEKPPQTPDSGSGQPPPAPATATWRGFAFRWFKRIGITALILIVISAIGLAIADHKTSQPEFCGSCHIMKPYYESWHADVHGGKLEIACVECHYAPGERESFTAKLRGLSQVASYISGRYGASRPRAHVDNRSCMTSKCHGDMGFMDKELSLGTVKFVHAKHLHFDKKKVETKEKELGELAQTLRDKVGAERFGKLEEAALEAVPVKPRTDRMTKMVRDWNINVEASQLERFAQLNHWQVRVAQLADLQCADCHSYGAPIKNGMALQGPGAKEKAHAAHHFSVKTTTCITCHFNNESFNSGTTSCLLCHALPTKEILVHSPEPDPNVKADFPKQMVRMDHQMILQKKVDCFACHADVASENAPVTRRDCERCHDRPDYFQKWNKPLSVEVVKHYHAVHVPEQRAKCLDCHSEIHHQLARGVTPAGQPQFLAAGLANCSQCHPNHHAEQIQLLSGVGGVGAPKGDPNLMFGARTNCFGCHIKQVTTEHGGVAMRGAINGCVACHGDTHNKTFDQWKKGLKVVLEDAEEAYASAKKMLENAKDLAPQTQRKADDLLGAAKADLRLVKTGNGVHNVMYSITLLDSVTARCQQVMALIEKGRKKP